MIEVKERNDYHTVTAAYATIRTMDRRTVAHKDNGSKCIEVKIKFGTSTGNRV